MTAASESHPAAVDVLTRGFALTIDLRDPLTGRHCRDVGTLTERLALALGHSPAQAHLFGAGGALHDLGKIGISDRILRNTDALSPREFALVRAHPEHGERILRELEALSPELGTIGEIVGAHHEWWDGRGYPRGVAGLDIPRGARIVAVADAYSAITMKRTYDPACEHADALEIIARGIGTHFDPEIVEALLALEQ